MLTLFLVARRWTDQPQPWALAPGVGVLLAGLALLLLTPGDDVLRWLGWLWPLLLALLVVWSVRGARRSLHNWSRRALLYPAFAVLGLVAVGGAYETVAAAASSNPAPSTGRTYTVAGHDLYLNCVGSGSPTVILFNGHMERTPSWAWVQPDVARETRVCTFDRAGQGWSGEGVGSQDAHELSDDVHALLAAARSWPVRYCRSLGRRSVRARVRDGLSIRRSRRRADRLFHPVSVRSAGLSRLLRLVGSGWRDAPVARTRRHRSADAR